MSMSSLILCMDWWRHGNDKPGLGATQFLGTLRHLNCAIHIMANLASITEHAHLMTSSRRKEEGPEHKENDTKLPGEHGICFKAA